MINPLLRSNPIRMMGMASGLDTESVIQQTMRLHQMRIDNQMRSRTILEWRQQTHNNIRSQINNIRNTFMTGTSMNNLLNRHAFNTNTARISTSAANNGAVSVRASSDASLGTMRIGQVVSLAKGASVSSTGPVSHNGAGFNPSARLDSLRFGGSIAFSTPAPGGSAIVSVNGMDISLTAAEMDGIRDSFVDGISEITKNGMTLTFRQTTNPVTNPHGFEFAGARMDFEDYKATALDEDGNRVSVSREAIEGANWQDWKSSLTTSDGTVINIVRTGTTENPVYSFFREDEDGNNVAITGPNLVFDDGEYKLNLGPGEDGEDIIFTLARDENGALRNSENNNRVLSFTREAEVEGINGEKINLTQTGNENSQIRTVGVNDQGRPVSAALGEFIGTREITVNGKPITLSSNMTVSQMMSEVNSRTNNTGATMTYDRMNDRFSITSNTINSEADDLTISGLEMFGLSQSRVEDGSLARVFINGEIVERNTNSFDFRGVSITLNRETTTGGTGALGDVDENTIMVTIERNVDDAVDKIKSFIDSYNTLIGKIEGLLRERQTGAERSYRPLTDEEKSSMTERQVEQWEEIARKGILRNDHGLRNLADSLRRELFSTIKDVGMTPADIGLTTGSFFSGTGGQIILDEDRLRAALEADPDKVADVFTKIGLDSEGRQVGVGFLHRVNTILNNYVRTNGTQNRTLQSLETSIRRANEQMDRLQQRMFAEEDKLYRQFAAMETALSRIQSQGDWFNAMLGSMQQGPGR